MKSNYFSNCKIKNNLNFSNYLVVLFFLVTCLSFSQTTYSFNYTGGSQTISLPAGSYSIACWGADGGVYSGNSGTLPGKGGYSSGNITFTAATTCTIYVGGKGNGGAQPLGGFNSGNGLTKTNTTTATGGGGASDVRVLVDNFFHRIIVAGGGGGQGTSTGTGGNGGGLTGQNGQGTTNAGVGGSQTAPGVYPAGGDAKPAIFGEGSDGPAGTTGGQGGGGWYGGSFGTRTNGGGAGGSGYVLTASSFTPTGYFSAYVNYFFTNTVTLRADQSGFITNPDLTGNGKVFITELCSISLSTSASGTINNVALCSGQSLTLTTNAVSNYSWSNNSTASSIVVTPTVTTAYSLTATSSLNCTASRVVLVNVSAGIPTLSINTSTNTICLGQAVTFTASGATTYTWSNGINNAVPFTPSASGSFSVIGQNGCGTSTAATAVTIAPLPVSLASSHSVVCAGSTSTLSAIAAANSYSWLPISSSNTFLVVSPQVNTNYTVVVSNGTCIGTNTIDVIALPVPTIVTSPSLTTVCDGVPVNLTASGGLSYTWTPVNLNGSSITVTPSIPTPYQVAGSNSLGCSSSANAFVIVNPNPTLNLIASTNLICAEDLVNISISGANSYSWNTGVYTTSINVTPTVTTIYSVIGELNGCTSTETVIISVFIPTLSITGNTSVCLGETTTLTASSANTYSWSNGFSSAVIAATPSVNTMYSVSALSASASINCPSSASVQINVKPLPNLNIVATSTSICKGESNTLTVSGASTYTWSTLSNGNQVIITPSLISTVNYSVVGIDTQGCSNTANISIKVNSCPGFEELIYVTDLFKLYPNPNNGKFTVSALTKQKIEVMNELGQIIKSIELNQANNFRLEIELPSSGIYFVQAQDGTNSKVTKIIVTK